VRDLISYGFLPEFVGRFPVVARLSALSTDEMMHVMTTPRNALLKQYCALFAADGVHLSFTTAAVDAIAKEAERARTGARGLRAIVERSLNEAMYNLPAWRARGVAHVVVTEETIVDGKLPLLQPEPMPVEEMAMEEEENAAATG